MAMRRREDDEVYPNAAAIDVGASSHWVAVPRTADDQPVREFGTMTADLHAMADWLLACGVDTVRWNPPESTGYQCTRYSSSAGSQSGSSMRAR